MNNQLSILLWLIVAIFSYFLLAGVVLVDKYLLSSSPLEPKVYTFYAGASATLIFLLSPFVGFSIPALSLIVLSLAAGAFFVYSLFFLFKALRLFDASMIVPAVGGILPLFSFLFVFLFSGGKEILTSWHLLSFFLLILGSVMITLKRSADPSLKSLKISALVALFLALSFILSKYVYLSQPFWSGLIWIKLGGGIAALTFLFFPETRRGLFEERKKVEKKTMAIFIANQLTGAGAGTLQNWAIALAPLAFIPIINALQGIQYVFLLIFTIFLSLKFPKILKEEISKEILLQKIVAILVIGAGLIILTLK